MCGSKRILQPCFRWYAFQTSRGNPKHAPKTYTLRLPPRPTNNIPPGLLRPFPTISGKVQKIRPAPPGPPLIFTHPGPPLAPPPLPHAPPRDSLPGDALGSPFGAVRGPIRPGTLFPAVQLGAFAVSPTNSLKSWNLLSCGNLRNPGIVETQ